jgi:hypothetical protein
VVLNVEATGTGGPDVLFREAGGWPAATYMRAAPHPTATATIRDLVRFANLPVVGPPWGRWAVGGVIRPWEFDPDNFKDPKTKTINPKRGVRALSP